MTSSSGYPAVSVAEYRGLTIKAVQDTDAANPWRDTDGLAPLLWTSGDGLQDDAPADDIESPLKSFTDRQLVLKWPKICAALGVDPGEAERDARQAQKDYGYTLGEQRRDLLDNALRELRPSHFRSWSAAVDYLAALEELWTLSRSRGARLPAERIFARRLRSRPASGDSALAQSNGH